MPAEDTARKRRVLVVGTLTLDVIGSTASALRADALTVPLDLLAHTPGGRGANVAVILAAMGHEVRLVSCVGRDFANTSYQRELDAQGIDCAGLFRSADSGTPEVFIFGNDTDSRVYQFRDRRPEHEDAFTRWAAKQAAQWPHEVVYCTSEVASANLAALRASISRYKVFAPGHDILTYDRALLDHCVAHADMLIVNSTEAQALESTLDRPFAILRESLNALVVTLGTAGSQLSTPDQVITLSCCQARQVVDTTGAGDAYAAGFVHKILNGGTVVDAAKTGSALASYVIESPGCQTGIPTPTLVATRTAGCYITPVTSSDRAAFPESG
jgi:ribokinase